MLRKANLFILCVAMFAFIGKAQNAASDSCYMESRHWYIKTNAVGLCMGVANLSFEFEVAKHLSFTIPMYYSGWDFPKHTAKLRTLAYQPELRYWLRHEGGFFGGAHFGIGWWNVALDGSTRYQDHNGHYPAYGGGVSFGWRSMPGKSPFRFECSVGAGYYHLYYDRFENVRNGELLGTEKKSRLLIDNLTFSVAYTFNMRSKQRCKAVY